MILIHYEKQMKYNGNKNHNWQLNVVNPYRTSFSLNENFFTHILKEEFEKKTINYWVRDVCGSLARLEFILEWLPAFIRIWFIRFFDCCSHWKNKPVWNANRTFSTNVYTKKWDLELNWPAIS